MVPRHEGSMAWEDGVLVGLSIWTVKSPRMEAGVGVGKSTVRQVPKSPRVVEDVLPAPVPTKACGPQAIRDPPLPCFGEYFPGPFFPGSSHHLIATLPDSLSGTESCRQ